MNYPSRDAVERLRKEYPTGTRIELLAMDDPQAPPAGTRGTVTMVDDTGTVHANWDNGCTLGAVYGAHEIKKSAS